MQSTQLKFISIEIQNVKIVTKNIRCQMIATNK